MSLPPPPGFAAFAATLTHALSVRTAVITMGCSVAVGNDASQTRSNIHGALFGAGNLLDPDFLDADWTITSSYLLQNDAGVFTSDEFVMATPGTLVTTTLPPNVSVVMNKRTALAGRQYRGRMAIPGAYMPESLVNDVGIIDAGTVLLMALRAAASLGDSIAQGNQFHLLHGLHGTPPVLPPPTPTPITSMTISPLVGTQRKRLRRT